MNSHDFTKIAGSLLSNPDNYPRAVQPLFRHLRTLSSPAPTESAAIALRSPKTAALFFDRVWGGFELAMPESIAFWSRTQMEIAVLLKLGIDLCDEEIPDPRRQYLPELSPADSRLSAKVEPLISDLARAIAATLRREKAVNVVPVYASAADRDREYQPGDRAALVATVEGLNVVSERDLNWQQVVDVRSDSHAVLKLRRLRHWLDREMIGKSRAYVEDEIALRIEDYEKALRKHGLASAIGSIATIFDSRVLIGGPAAVAALSYAGVTEWAMVAGTGILVGSAAVHVAKKMLTYQDLKENAEICFLVDLKRKSRGLTLV